MNEEPKVTVHKWPGGEDVGCGCVAMAIALCICIEPILKIIEAIGKAVAK